MSLTDIYIGGKLCEDFPINLSLCRRKPAFPGSLTDLHRFRKTAHGHDGSSRIVMVRKTDQRTFASVQNGKVSGNEGLPKNLMHVNYHVRELIR